MVPTELGRMQMVSYEALFKKHRPEMAIKLTKRRISRGWSAQVDEAGGRLTWSRVTTPDEWLAQQLNIPIRRITTPPSMGRPSRVVHTLGLTPQDVPLNSEAAS